MKSLTDLPEFAYGYPSTRECYGLWSPLLDCFILIDDNVRHLEKVQALTVGKILTVLVKLDEKLYQENIIDNSCASNWTISEFETINFTLVTKRYVGSHIVTKLIPAEISKVSEAHDFQAWFMFVLHWVKKIEAEFADPFLQLPALAFGDTSVFSIQQKIYRTLLLFQNIDHARQTINDIVKAYE
jgi:hypothetical protein